MTEKRLTNSKIKNPTKFNKIKINRLLFLKFE